MLAEVRALPRPAGCGRGGSGSPSAPAGSCAPAGRGGEEAQPSAGPPTCLGSGQPPPRPGRTEAPASSPGAAPGPSYHPTLLPGRALFPRQGPAGRGTLQRRGGARPAVPAPCGSRPGRALPAPRSAGGWACPPGQGPRGRSSAAGPVSGGAHLARRRPASALGLAGDMSPPGPRAPAPTSAPLASSSAVAS